MAAHVVRPSSGRHAREDLLCIDNVGKVYGRGGAMTTALNDLSLTVRDGEFVSVMGPSGSGKSTLLNCVATIDAVTSGSIRLAGEDVTRLRGRELARFRRERLGFIFQDANLVETLTGFENVALALTIKGSRPVEIGPRVRVVAERLGVMDVLDKYPHQMSGGQRQRVAAARAVVGAPSLVLADEPTGSLDSKSARVLLETLEKIHRNAGATIMMVTHDAYAASFSQRTVFIKDGTLFNEVVCGTDDRKGYFGRIMEVVSFLGGGASHVG
ncbi:ABC transporter ATP-binding protein [Olsenella massiliensis]|uniref:ABC transporter ATP-binding protein n=1 Tax=Olsenella massiliensis TaxID=1622075 RepID=UPI00071E36CF|nr:ABC transporter ATP-binding protein [Olsenella massiliensis]